MTNETTSKHTPGPWNDYIEIGSEKQIQVLTVPFAGPYVEQAWADARLIAAAPDMYEALKYALRQIEMQNSETDGFVVCHVCRGETDPQDAAEREPFHEEWCPGCNMRAAIARAEGRAS